MASVHKNARSDPEQAQFEHELIALMPTLKRFAQNLTRCKDAAEDLAQEAICRALDSRHQFAIGTNLQAWLFVIARNIWYSGQRRAHRWVAWDEELAKRALTTGLGTTEAEAAYDLRCTLLESARLPHGQSEALRAVGYLGMSYEEAAREAGCPVNTIKSRVKRGRAELAQRLGNDA
jgi:RNA polymerase sigma-70 factor (ECF subfamily)